MEYLPIKAIAKQFAIPSRTVYDKIAKNPSVRMKKDGRTKLIHVADFAKVAKRELQTVSQVAISEPESESGKDIAILQNSLQELQQDLETVNEKKLALQKVNTNLETSLNKFILLHSDEKTEKKERIEKHDQLQKRYHAVSMKFYLLVGIGSVLMILALIFNISSLQEFVASWR